MPDDLGLEALARIQALDARREVSRFRDRWLDGGVLSGETEAVAWMRDRLEAPSEAVVFEMDFGEPFTVSPRSQWRKAGYAWLSFDAEGNSIAYHKTHYGWPMRELGDLTCRLAEAFGRTWAREGPMFALTGEPPVLPPVEWVAHQAPHDANRIRNASGILSQEVALFVRPQATIADVSSAYQEAQRRICEDTPLSPRERIRPMTSPRMRDLAVFGARIALWEFASWSEAMAAYNAEHDDDHTYRHASDKGRFRRDVRAAYRRVTGLDLCFRPDRQGSPPMAEMQWQQKGTPTTLVPTGQRAKSNDSAVVLKKMVRERREAKRTGGGTDGR